MTYETAVSSYPDLVDPWIFFQDLSNDKEQDYNTFVSKTEASEYTEAQQYAHEKSIDIVDAHLLMCLQNRIKSLQHYIFENKEKPSHHIFDISPTGYEEIAIYDDQGNIIDYSVREKPVDNIPNNTIWVSSYNGGAPLLTQGYDALVTEEPIEALGYNQN